MGIVDLHCDALYKLLTNKSLKFKGGDQKGLDVTYERLVDSRSALQVFAVYLPPELEGNGLMALLESIDLFYEEVLALDGVTLIQSRRDLETCLASQSIGAMLSLEGVSVLQPNPEVLLRLMRRLGVRAVGLTWNGANWAADGVLEPRGGGLTSKGKAFVLQCRALDLILDVSHLSEQAFWEVAAMGNGPLIASHSNARSICDHPRNLTDMQIGAIIQTGGLIGVTYVPWFLTGGGKASIEHVVKHIEYICSLGGADCIALGSDFDGIDIHPQGLAHPGELYGLREALSKRYSEDRAEAFLSQNALSFLRRSLPNGQD